VQYKTEKDGVIETRIEKRLVISGTTASDVDHDKVYSTPHWHLPVSQHLPVLEHLPVSALASTEKTREINLFNAVPKTFKDAKFYVCVPNMYYSVSEKVLHVVYFTAM